MSAQGESSYATYNQNATINSVGTAEYLIDGASSYEAIWAQPKPRSYNYHINNKVKRLALLSVLPDKAANGNMVVVDKFACDEYKTKTVVSMLNAVGAGKKNLLVNETVDAKFVKSAGNIAGVKTTFAGSVNTYDVLNADKLIISVDAAKKLEEVLG